MRLHPETKSLTRGGELFSAEQSCTAVRLTCFSFRAVAIGIITASGANRLSLGDGQ